MEYTPENITELKPKEIFIYGSNEAGKHGAGAAKLAHERFGARWGQGFGLAGSSFGLPTKNWEIEVLPLNIIQFYVDRFMYFANIHPELKFYVTKIGCGLALYTPNDIAPLFFNYYKDFYYKDLRPRLKNVILPEEFYHAYH